VPKGHKTDLTRDSTLKGRKTTNFTSMPKRPKRAKNTLLRYRQQEFEVKGEANLVQGFLTKLLNSELALKDSQKRSFLSIY
jgi:hypothetical protein